MASGSVTQLDDGRYTVRWRTPDGRQPRRTFSNRKTAERFLRKTLTEIEEHGIVGAGRGETLESALTAWWVGIEPTVRPRTVERYQRHRDLLVERYGDTPLDRVDYQYVGWLVNDLATVPAKGRSKPYAAKTIHAIYGVLSLALKHAALTGKIRPVQKPRLPKVEDREPTVPTRDEVEVFADKVDLRLRAMVILAGYVGLRQGELLGIERRNVRLAEQRIWIAHAVSKTTQQLEPMKTKGSRRWVVLPQRALDVLTWHMEEVETGDRVFPYTASMVDKAWRRVEERTGIRFHDLRHAAASMMIASGWNIMQVSRQLGHSQPSLTLNVYGFLYPESFADAVDKLDAYLAEDGGGRIRTSVGVPPPR